MKKIPPLPAQPVNGGTFLMALLVLLGISHFWVTGHPVVLADFIQGKIPSTEALIQWITIR